MKVFKTTIGNYEKENTLHPPVYTDSPLFDDIVFISRELQTIGSFVSRIFEPRPSSPWKYIVSDDLEMIFLQILRQLSPQINDIIGGCKVFFDPN